VHHFWFISIASHAHIHSSEHCDRVGAPDKHRASLQRILVRLDHNRLEKKYKLFFILDIPFTLLQIINVALSIVGVIVALLNSFIGFFLFVVVLYMW